MTLLLSCILMLPFSINAQNKKQRDRKSIKAICGCYEVSFNFEETFNYSKDSLYRPSDKKITGGLEWAQLITNKEDTLVIQHLLQVGDPDNPTIIKHWRQDWLYENTDFYMYNVDNNWVFEEKNPADVSGQWTQKVYQVDDSPRYEGSATWVHVDGKEYWENTTNAPLPRREYTQRNDYNLTVRGNRVEITNEGWIHDQDNKKVIRKPGKKDVLLAKEKGHNVYTKVDDSRCQASIDWWKEHKAKWALVRKKWEEVFAKNKDLSLKTKVDHKHLYKYLFDEDMTGEKEIDKTIESFVKYLL